MTTTLFVGNLPPDITKDQLRSWFSDHGAVGGVRIPTDYATKTVRGFAFVSMADREAAESARAALNGCEYAGRRLVVSFAREPYHTQ